jgi:Domain of unknown function (DUF4251)
MKRIFIILFLINAALLSCLAQNKKAERDSLAQVKYTKALAAIEAKDFVIIPSTYMTSTGSLETSTDDAVFMSYEKDFVFMQGAIVAGNSYTNKLTVSDYSQVADKKGNIIISMQVKGFYITAKVQINLRKGSSFADVFITPTRGDSRRFSGEVVPRAESKYFKRSGEI